MALTLSPVRTAGRGRDPSGPRSQLTTASRWTSRLARRAGAARLLDRAYRDPDPRIPAGRLRRRRGPCRVPGPRAAQAHRRRRALLRRRPAGRRRSPHRRPRPGRRERRADHAVGRPVDGRRDRRRRVAALAHLVRQHGRAHRQAAATASRTWSPRTRWSRTGRGRPSSSAAGTGCRPGPRRPPTRPPTRSSRCQRGMRADILESYPALDPARVHVIRNGIDTEIYHPDRRDDVLTDKGVDPTGRSRVRRPDHPAEGRRPPGRGHPPFRPGRAAGAVRRRAGHPGDRRGDREGRRRSCRPRAPGVFWFDGMLTLPEVSRCCRPRRCSSARRSTSRWAS